MAETITIDAKPPLCTVTVETADGKQVAYWHVAFVPAVGDELDVKVKSDRMLRSWEDPADRWQTFRVVRRRWDLTDDSEPCAVLTVELIAAA